MRAEKRPDFAWYRFGMRFEIPQAPAAKPDGGKEDPAEVIRKREARKQEAQELLGRGWKSTGDVPYIIARSLQKKPQAISIRMNQFLEEALAAEKEEYRATNRKKIGPKTFVSPDLLVKTEVEAKRYYESTYESTKREAEKQMSTAWALQADVVSAMIVALRKEEPTLESVIDSIVANELVRTTRTEVRSSVSSYLLQKHQLKFEEGGAEKLLADLEQQQTWLADQHNLPPPLYLNALARSTREAIQETYGKKPDETR